MADAGLGGHGSPKGAPLVQRLRPLLVISCVLVLVLGVAASNAVVPTPAPRSQPATATASSSHGPSVWQRLLGHLGVGAKESGGKPATAAVPAGLLPRVGPAAKPAAARPAGPVRRVRELV